MAMRDHLVTRFVLRSNREVGPLTFEHLPGEMKARGRNAGLEVGLFIVLDDRSQLVFIQEDPSLDADVAVPTDDVDWA